MKKIYIAVLVSFLALGAKAQQDPQFSHNMFNRLPVNPGVAGSGGSLCITSLGRHQWSGFSGQPNTGLISADMPVPLLYGGVGATFYYDNLGNEKTFAGKLAYAFRLPLGAGHLGIGADAGVMNKAVSGTWKAPDGTNGQNDQSIPQTFSATAPDFSFGMYYNTDRMYLGVSSTHLSASQIKDGSVKYMMARHYYVMAGYAYDAGTLLQIKPSILAKTDAASTQLDINLLADYNNQFWGGVSYRLQDAIVALVGVKFGSFRVGYSYDVTTSKIRGYSSGSHEIMLGYCFKPMDKKPTQKHHSVRFL
jgi:type IX secretion system PorP/SprF family membrane protein